MPQTNPPAGPELDRLACEALTRAGCAGWGPLEQSVDVDPDQSPRYVQFWPRISKSWAIAGRALEAMRGQGWEWDVTSLGNGKPFDCTFARFNARGELHTSIGVEGGTGPHAIALAIVAALEEGN